MLLKNVVTYLAVRDDKRGAGLENALDDVETNNDGVGPVEDSIGHHL